MSEYGSFDDRKYIQITQMIIFFLENKFIENATKITDYLIL